MSTRTLTDYEIMAIGSHLPLKNKLRLMSVSKQFRDCFERLFKSQKCLDVRLRSLARRARRSDQNDDIVIYEKIVDRLNRVLEIDFEDVKNKFEATLLRFTNLKTINLSMNTNSPAVLEWISHLFPDLVSIKVRITTSNEWSQSKIDAIINCFGSKCESIEVRRYRNFDRLVAGAVFRMAGLKSLTLCFNPGQSLLMTIIRELSPLITDLRLDFLISSDINDILSLLKESNTRHIKNLKVLFTIHSDGNHILKFFAKHFVRLESLHLVCGSVDTIGAIKYAKRLKSLQINPMNISVIDISRSKRNPLSDQLKRLKIYGNCLIKPEVIASVESLLPNIQVLILNNLKVYCICENRIGLCLTCYQTFLHNCSQLIHKFGANGRALTIELLNENNEPYHQIILLSMFGLYFDLHQSFKLNIKSYRTEYVCVVVLEAANLMAYRRPDLSFKLIFNRQISYNLENFTKILASNLKLEFSDISFNAMVCSEELLMVLESGTNRDQIVIYFGNKCPFMKMFSIEIYV